jgi:hypothetical protein
LHITTHEFHRQMIHSPNTNAKKKKILPLLAGRTSPPPASLAVGAARLAGTTPRASGPAADRA